MKKLYKTITLKLPAGNAVPKPPLSSVLGPLNIKIIDFCNFFNTNTLRSKGLIISVRLTIFLDKTYKIKILTPTTTSLILNKIKSTKGVVFLKSNSVGALNISDIEEIASIKQKDLQLVSLSSIKKCVISSAKSLGVVCLDI